MLTLHISENINLQQSCVIYRKVSVYGINLEIVKVCLISLAYHTINARIFAYYIREKTYIKSICNKEILYGLVFQEQKLVGFKTRTRIQFHLMEGWR